MSQNIKFKYRHDITALENTYGELSKGKVIEVTIQEL